ARRTPDGVWQDTEFPFGTEAGWVPSAAEAITMDTVGNVLVAGELRSRESGTLTTSLVIQKLAARVLPPLAARHSGTSLILGWPAALNGAQLESSDTLDAGANWMAVTNAPVVVGNEQTVTLNVEPGANFFRLKKP